MASWSFDIDRWVPAAASWSAEERMQGTIVLWLSGGLAALTPLTFVGNLWLGAGPGLSAALALVVATTGLPALILVRSGDRNLAGAMLSFIGLISTAGLAWWYDGIRSPVTLSLGLIPMLSVVVCEPRTARLLWALTALTLIGLFVATDGGALPSPMWGYEDGSPSLWLWNQFCFQVIGVGLVALLRRESSRLFEAQRLANAQLDEALTAARTAQEVAEQAKAEAERMAKARADFLATMSHEIRTPMNGVLGMADLLLESDLDSRQVGFAWTIASAARALVHVIDDVLDFSKLEAGKIQLEVVPFSPHQLVYDVTRLLEREATGRGLVLDAELIDLPDTVVGDPTRTRQILYNLVGNAIKFTNTGSVRVEARWKDDLLRLAVVDTGVGIPPEKLGHIFEAFTQADASTTREFGGTGLGLTISRGLCVAMGGDLTVQSALGQGSRFEACLPMPESDDVPAVEHVGARDEHGRSLRVLVAEDNPVNQKVARAMLERLGHTPIIVDHGQLAVQRWGDGDIDIILMDWQMPVLDGLEATRQIRAAEQAPARVPILAMTANVLDGDRERCEAVGMDGLIGKPLTLARLEEALALHGPG